MKFNTLPLVFTFIFLASIVFAQVTEPKVHAEVTIPPPAPPPIPEVKYFTSNQVSPTPTRVAYHGQQNGRYGFYKGSEWLVPPVYDELDKEYSDFMRAKKNNKYGFIDRSNNVVVPFEYDKIFPIYKKYTNWKDREEGGLYKLEKAGKIGIVDKTGTIKIPVKYTVVEQLKENMFSVGSEEQGYGVVNLDLEILIPFEYESYIHIADQEKMIFQTEKDGKIGWIDQKNNVVLPFEYEKIDRVGYPVASHYDFKKDGKWGFMHLNGQIIVPPKYDSVNRKIGSIMLVTDGDKTGVVRKGDFKEMIPPIFCSADRISGTFIKVQGGEFSRGGGYGVIDTLGNLILDTVYQGDISAGAGDLIFAKANGKKKWQELYAVHNREGKQIIPPTFTFAYPRRHFYEVSRGSPEKERALMNSKGDVITPYIYNKFEIVDKRDSKGEYIIYAERSDMKGTLRADGTENDDFQPMNSNQNAANQAALDKQKEQLLFKELQGEWYGLNHQGFLNKIYFLTADSGISTIYFLKEDEECAIEYVFAAKILPSMSMIRTQPLSQQSEIRCYKPSAEFLKIKDQQVVGGFLDFSTPRLGKEFLLKGYTKKESPETTKDSDDLLKKIKIFKELEAEFSKKVEPKPGGLRQYPVFKISETTNEVWVINHSKYLFGKMVEVEGEYIFEPRKWATPKMTYFLSGILRNVRYLNANGKVETGDLDIGFLATESEPYYFKKL